MNSNSEEFKENGFLKQKQEEHFIARFRSIAGNLTSQQMRQLADLADRYGRGYVHITTRQGAEIPWIGEQDYDQLSQEIRSMGLKTGASGARIRTVVACPGHEVCRFGLMNSRKTAVELDRAFFGREVPKKTKIAVSGCPNSCAKPQENDIGLVGTVEPYLEAENCTGCGLCRKICPNSAIGMVDGKPVIDKVKCLMDGKCIATCPASAWREQRRGYLLYAGGKIGRKPGLGRVVARFVREEEAAEAVARVLQTFLRLARQGERLADTMARVGLEEFKSMYLKEEIVYGENS